MIFKDLILKANPDKVAEILETKFEVYDDDITAHLNVLERLKYITPVKSNKNQSIYVSEIEGDEDGVPYVDYDVSRFTPDDEFTHQGFLFTPWAEWLGMEVHETTLAIYPTDFIVAAALWELTFNGFEESECKEFTDDVKNKVDQIKNGVIKIEKCESVQEYLDIMKDDENDN